MVASPLYSSPEEVEAYKNALSRADALKRRSDQLAAQLETVNATLETKRTRLSLAKSALDKQLKKVIELLGEEELFKGVPLDGPKAVTDSDGQFTMKLRAHKRYVIAAKAQRRVFDTTEQYYWLIWVSLEGAQPKQIMLTNNNLMGTDSPDSVFKSKELIPTGLTEH